MFYIAGISIALFIEALILSKKKRSVSDLILLVWMFVIVLHLFLFYMRYSGESYNFPFLLGIELPLPLLHGVFLFMYTASMTNRLPHNSLWISLHFLPALVFYIYLLSVFMFLPGEEKIFVYQNKGAGFETFNLIRKITIWVSGIVYVVWSNLLLWKHRRSILNQFSNVEKVNLNWLRLLIWGIGLIWMTVIFFSSENITFSAVVVFIFVIGFFGIRQTGIYTPESIIPPHGTISESKRTSGNKEKYSKSGLNEAKSAELYNSLIELMTAKELYKNNELLINDLAVNLDIHPNYLSQVINEKEGKNFYDFVNSYRLKEFKRLLTIPKYRQFTLLSIALECGFNSKSSFNRYFKKETGQTPSQYFALISKA